MLLEGRYYQLADARLDLSAKQFLGNQLLERGGAVPIKGLLAGRRSFGPLHRMESTARLVSSETGDSFQIKFFHKNTEILRVKNHDSINCNFEYRYSELHLCEL
jgi:hypothetical protein